MKPSITPITAGQKDNGVNVVAAAARKGSEEAFDELSASGVIHKDNFQRILGLGDKLTPLIKQFVKEKIAALAENIAGCLKLISGAHTLVLEPTDGKETIANARDVFTGFLDRDFHNYGTNIAGPATGETNVAVHEMIKDGDFRAIFNGLGDDLNKLCLTQAQIIQFVKKHRDWLRTEGFGTFFLFKVGEEFFVASVDVSSDGRLRVRANRFSYVDVWFADFRHRVVVPQLTLEK